MSPSEAPPSITGDMTGGHGLFDPDGSVSIFTNLLEDILNDNLMTHLQIIAFGLKHYRRTTRVKVL